MTERFTIPPDAKARLAMRERRDASHDANSRHPLSSECIRADLTRPGDDGERESASADLG